ncbi:DUF1697 domain-containing protein [Pelagibacterium halotolerans]|uniref:DUF1697 domain-containing protein n=1 Tax=Pelagibacterium halotolerans TaxID=531813 RepID=UPI00384D2729
MTVFVALLRAVNVGGTGKLPMETLRAMCAELGFENVETYIASGNVVLRSDRSADEVKTALEDRLAEYAGKPVGVMIRTAEEIAQILKDNPFPDAPGNRVTATFLDVPPPADALDAMQGHADEEAVAGRREIYIHYPSGMGNSKLTIKAAKAGTARNLNTVAKLAEMAKDA